MQKSKCGGILPFMKQLIAHIQKSIYGPEYYRELLGRPFSFSWKYYAALALLFSVFLTIITSIPIIPKLNDLLRELPQAVLAYYPDELELTIEKGVVSSNVTEPYYLPMPAILKDEIGEAQPRHFLVIDTATPFGLEQFASHGALVWIGRDFISYYEDGDSIATQKLESDLSFVLNEQVLSGLIQMTTPYFKFVTPVLVVLFFLGFLMMFAVNLIYLFFGALLIFLLGKLLKEHWGYWKSYQIGMHAVTLPLLLNGALLIFMLGLTQIPLLYTLIMLVVVYFNFTQSKSVVPMTESEQPPAVPPLRQSPSS